MFGEWNGSWEVILLKYIVKIMTYTLQFLSIIGNEEMPEVLF